MTVTERVFEEVREAIVVGAIPAGSKISEPELSRQYSSSRASLRDALGRLEASGLVVRTPNVGARVVSLSLGGLLDLYSVRESLEGMAARLAAHQMSEESIEGLLDLLARHGRQIESAEQQEYFQKEGDADFHYCIALGSGNNHLIRMLGHDFYHLMRMYRCQFGMRSSRVPRAYLEHELIADAIVRRDGEQAEQLMRHHIRASRHNAERMLTDSRLEEVA